MRIKTWIKQTKRDIRYQYHQEERHVHHGDPPLHVSDCPIYTPPLFTIILSTLPKILTSVSITCNILLTMFVKVLLFDSVIVVTIILVHVRYFGFKLQNVG